MSVHLLSVFISYIENVYTRITKNILIHLIDIQLNIINLYQVRNKRLILSPTNNFKSKFI